MAISLSLLLSIIFFSIWSSWAADDKYLEFLNLLSRPSVKQCPDKTYLMPNCKICIPGLESASPSGSCVKYTDSSKAIRDEIKKLTEERYGKESSLPNRPFGLYPCMFTNPSSFSFY